ncbi:hypothetical protein OG21DRAFT_1514707 [Imleria badia]|nr:hypothetical protein OG21DRAFT_1514707 [Imleria badia]
MQPRHLCVLVIIAVRYASLNARVDDGEGHERVLPRALNRRRSPKVARVSMVRVIEGVRSRDSASTSRKPWRGWQKNYHW